MVIFYADDDQDELDFFCQALKIINSGIICITATNGKQALNILNNVSPPDFIFLDLNMPLLDGRACLAEIKKDERLKAVPVIVYSNIHDTAEIDRLYKLGAIRFLTKICSITELAEALRFILKEQMSIVKQA